MVVIEIAANANCEAVDLRVFHDLEPARPIRRVRVSHGQEPAQWHEVVGWTAAGQSAPALAQPVDDSGEGVAVLVRGADAGLRLRPAGSNAPWSLEQAQQWGAPFLLLGSTEDIQLAA